MGRIKVFIGRIWNIMKYENINKAVMAYLHLVAKRKYSLTKPFINGEYIRRKYA